MNKKIAIIALISTSLLLGACNNQSSNNATVATVNGVKITEKQFYEKLKETHGKDVLNQLVYQQLLEKKYKASEKEIKAMIDEVKKTQGITDDAQLEEALKQSGLTMKQFEDNIRLNVLMKQARLDGVKISEEDLKAEFENIKNDIRASHILVTDEAKANELLSKIKNGEDFSTLARENSTDTQSATNGGDLGFFGKGAMVKPFEEAAFKLKVGEVSGLVKSEFGYHIIKVTEIGRKFEDEKEAIRLQLEESKAKTTEQVFSELIEKNKVKVNDSSLKDAFPQLTEEK